ncbi:hypothetical protein [Paenibacillus sp. PAMC21692]|uniref:hypothetical protein n=1 Tax=Paenibacillus sp. PAMC21692 TaxID=2762320 RepID=UPI00164DE8AA|nr:hypothetical protein [Paenibacillus sp. PAMC21692]QNK56981.1 hypothetical protein H7F31_31535 [Paenibacillus sp. PAMC21692]
MFKPGFLDESLLPSHDFPSLTLSYLFKDEWDARTVRSDLRLSMTEQHEFDQLIARIEREYNERQSGYYAIIQAYMIDVIVKIIHGSQSRSENDYPQLSEENKVLD